MTKIKQIDKETLFTKAFNDSAIMGETNDCGLKAISIATGVSYKEVHEIMKRNGRKDGQGTFLSKKRETLEILGWRMELIDHNEFKNKFPSHHKNLKYVTSHSFRRFPEAFSDIPPVVIAFTAGHVFAVMDGKNCDWSVNHKLRIKSMYKIFPIID